MGDIGEPNTITATKLTIKGEKHLYGSMTMTSVCGPPCQLSTLHPPTKLTRKYRGTRKQQAGFQLL
jgi:hypothetical protein